MEDIITIGQFEPGMEKDFKRLNDAWLKKYFRIEPADSEALGDPQQHILEKGGSIFFIKVNQVVAGTFALVKLDEGIFELSKMAVDEAFQGKKLGNRMMQHCMEVAQQMQIKKLVLYSNRVLLPALHLYQKYGFVEVPMNTSVYDRANIIMEKIIA